MLYSGQKKSKHLFVVWIKANLRPSVRLIWFFVFQNMMKC